MTPEVIALRRDLSAAERAGLILQKLKEEARRRAKERQQ